MAWLENLPYTFHAHSGLWITKLSTAASLSSVLLAHLPPGTVTKEFNMTVVAYVSDILGSTAVTSIGVDGVPLAITSTPPEQVRCGKAKAHSQYCDSTNPTSGT